MSLQPTAMRLCRFIPGRAFQSRAGELPDLAGQQRGHPPSPRCDSGRGGTANVRLIVDKFDADRASEMMALFRQHLALMLMFSWLKRIAQLLRRGVDAFADRATIRRR